MCIFYKAITNLGRIMALGASLEKAPINKTVGEFKSTAHPPIG